MHKNENKKQKIYIEKDQLTTKAQTDKKTQQYIERKQKQKKVWRFVADFVNDHTRTLPHSLLKKKHETSKEDKTNPNIKSNNKIVRHIPHTDTQPTRNSFCDYATSIQTRRDVICTITI